MTQRITDLAVWLVEHDMYGHHLAAELGMDKGLVYFLATPHKYEGSYKAVRFKHLRALATRTGIRPGVLVENVMGWENEANSLASSTPSSPAASTPTTLELPTPPSTNQLYSGRRFKTAAYKAWIKEAGWELRRAYAPTITGQFELTLYMPGRADLDNVKAIPDLLKVMGVIEDDSPKYMRKLTVVPTDGPCRVEIVPL